jgi:GntR family transcriptional repressor for pyruvate dehydrogenase complex
MAGQENGEALRPPRSRRTDKVSEVIAREIMHDIVRRDLQPGTMLPSEATMLETYGVGRGSLREALRILEVHGLIAIKPGPGGGPAVAGATGRDFGRMATLFFHYGKATFTDLIQARLVMEPVMARLAAERGGEEVRLALQANLDQMNDAMAARSVDAYLDASTGFHGVIAGLSGNRVLDLFGGALKTIYFDRVASGVAVFPDDARETVVHAHEAIAQAVIKGDATLAERLMREHMDEYADFVAQRLPGLLDEILDWR